VLRIKEQDLPLNGVLGYLEFVWNNGVLHPDGTTVLTATTTVEYDPQQEAHDGQR
jgi:hypothetical protein